MLLFGILLVVATVNAFNYTDFVNEDILYPKCCPYGEYLVRLNDTNFICETIPRVRYDIRAELVLNYTYEGNITCPEEDCVDFYVNGAKKELIVPKCNSTGIYEHYIRYVEYPKCCPVGYAYDPQTHGCTKSKTNKFENIPGLLVFNISLSTCTFPKAIIDHSDLNGMALDENRTITMKNGRRYNIGSYCLDENARTGADILRVCDDYDYACKKSFDDTGVRCVRKCCVDGDSYVGKKCVTSVSNGINITHEKFHNSTDYNFGVLAAPVGKKYVAKPNHNFFIDDIGNMHSIEERFLRIRNSYDAKYCVDSVSGQQKFFLFFAVKSQIESIKFDLGAAMLSISCVFLLLTFIIYLLLPEMHNLFGKSIMMYCVISFVGYCILAYTQVFSQTISKEACGTIGFVIMYAFLSSFSWLNIICFDMWMAFGQMRIMNVRNKSQDNKRFLLYNLYGWGLPTVITLFAVATYQFRFLPESFIPHIGNQKCYFEKPSGSYDHVLFFVGPVTIMLVCNSILFTKTILYCFKVKDEINRMKDTTGERDKRNKKFNTDKEKLFMLLKLFLIMGISWLFEVLSSLFSFKYSEFTMIVEVVWDTFNCLQGLFIFLIFIFKKKVLLSLERRLFPKLKNRRASEQSTTMSTSLSTYVKGRDNRKISDSKTNFV